MLLYTDWIGDLVALQLTPELSGGEAGSNRI